MLRAFAVKTVPVLVACCAALVGLPAASAACNISQTKCALNGGKCNIKFKNRTGDASGLDGHTKLNQTSSAQEVNVKARKRNGDKAGNKLTINAGASGTMNFDKKAKKKFQDVRLYSKMNRDHVGSIILSCEEIITVLNGSGVCKIFHGHRHTTKSEKEFFLGYKCAGGDVFGPTGSPTM